MWFWKKKFNNYPKFYNRYLEKIRDEGFSTNLVCFDLETTGLDYKTTEVLSFGGVQIKNSKIKTTDSLQCFFHSTSSLNQSTIIHEIIPHKDSKSIADQLPAILTFISNYRILGHFVEFDVNIINRELKKIGLPKLRNPTLDTLKIALKYDGVHNIQYAKKDEYTLFSLAKRFELEMQHTHNALEDAYVTALLYLHLQLKKSNRPYYSK
jgi:DNA polymerase-3 subunit epsilon